MENLTPEQLAEQAQNDLAAAQHSVDLVNELVIAGDHAVDDRVWANWKHLEIVMARQNVIDYVTANSVDTTAITAAIAAGSAFSPNQPE